MQISCSVKQVLYALPKAKQHLKVKVNLFFYYLNHPYLNCNLHQDILRYFNQIMELACIK